MIKYNLNTINDWNFGDDNIIKVYRNNAVCYYKITSGGDTPTAQTPCFAVVEDISQYSYTEFEDVFNKADNKWYKLNNLNQYEEYGIYGSGRTITTYDGKLTIDTESTPQPSRLPQGYTEVEYIRQNSNYDAYINTGVILFDNTSNTYTLTTRLSSEFHSNLGCATIISCERVNSPYDGLGYRYKCSSTVDQLEFFGGNPNYSSSSVDNGDGTRTITFTSTGNSSFTTDVPLSYMAAFSSTTYGANASWRHSDSTIYSATVVKNGVTVRDFVPAKRDSDNKYGLYDLITDTFYTSPNGNNFSGGSEVTPPPITKTYEYIYSGGSWINVGEVSGSTIIIKSPEYIEKDSSHNGKINLDYVWKTNSKMQFKFYSTNNGGGAMIGEDGMPDNNDCRMFFASTTAYFDWGSSRISWSSNGRANTLYEYEYGNYYIKNMVTSTSKTGSTISTSRTNTLYLGLGGTDRFRTYYLKFYDGDTLVKDFIPWTDTNGNYGLYEKVSNTIYSATSGSFTASSVWNDVEVGGGYDYPLEYVVREDPPNNLTFSSMTEAESYECPWVGMVATIDGDRYIFSGDSQSGYEWVYSPILYQTLQELINTYPTGGTASSNYHFTNYSDVSGITYFRFYPSKGTSQSSYVYADHNSDNATGTTKFAIKADTNGSFYSRVGGYNSIKEAADSSSCTWAYWVDADTIEVNVVEAVGTTIFIKQWQTYFVTDIIAYKFG